MKKFFVNIWEWIKKAWSICVRFFKENIWASVLGILAAIFIFVLIIQGIVKAIDSCNTKEEQRIENMATPITSTQLKEKLDNGDEFVLFIGSKTCGHCAQFHQTINTYITSTGKEIFYYETDDETDLNRTRMNIEIEDRLINEIPDDRKIEGLATPTTVYIDDGLFLDAIQGAYGMEGGTNYLVFCEVIEGKYVDKPSYLDKLEGQGGVTE